MATTRAFLTQLLLLFFTAFWMSQISAFSTGSPFSAARSSFGRNVVQLFDVSESSSSESSSSSSASSSSSLSPSLLNYKTQWQVDDSYTKTASGLLYKDTKVGSGDSPDEGSTIGIHYAFWLDQFQNEDDTTGTLYFETRNEKNPKNEPLGMQYGEDAKLLKGWLEGMKTLKKGGKRTLIISPELGYGNQEIPANPPRLPAIPVGSYLRFEVEMVDVDNSAWTKFRRMVPKPSAIFD